MKVVIEKEKGEYMGTIALFAIRVKKSLSAGNKVFISDGDTEVDVRMNDSESTLYARYLNERSKDRMENESD
jgi:hypothetical protein